MVGIQVTAPHIDATPPNAHGVIPLVVFEGEVEIIDVITVDFGPGRPELNGYRILYISVKKECVK